MGTAAIVVIIIESSRRGGGGGWRGAPPLKPFSELIKRLGPRRSMATGRRLQYPSRQRAAHARGCWIDRDSLGSIALRPRPSSRPPLPGNRGSARSHWPAARGGSRAARGQLVSVAGGLAPGAGRCRLPSDLSRLGEGDAGGKGAKGGPRNPGASLSGGAELLCEVGVLSGEQPPGQWVRLAPFRAEC